MRLTVAIALLALGSVADGEAKTRPALPDELVLSGENVINVAINGEKLRLEVRPEAADAPMLNPNIAARLQLKPGMFGFRSAVGSDRVNGASAVHRVDYGAGEKKQRIFWADRPSSSIADGTISPASLPYRRVRFVLKPAMAGESELKFPLDNFGFLGRLGIGTTLDVDGEKVRLQFSLQRDETLVSAPTGNWLAQMREGRFTGEPRQTLIYYSITRPTRAMTLAKPITVGKAALATVDVRYSDYGDASGIAEADSEGGDSDEIVVVGTKDRKPELRIVAGRQFLQRCSSLTYDLQIRSMVLNCAAD